MKNNYDANYTNKLFIGDLKKAKILLLMSAIHLK